MIIAGWSFGVVDMIIQLSPFSSYIYVPETYGYDRNFSLPWSGIVLDIEFWFANCNTTITAVLYCIIVAVLCYKVRGQLKKVS